MCMMAMFCLCLSLYLIVTARFFIGKERGERGGRPADRCGDVEQAAAGGGCCGAVACGAAVAGQRPRSCHASFVEMLSACIEYCLLCEQSFMLDLGAKVLSFFLSAAHAFVPGSQMKLCAARPV